MEGMKVEAGRLGAKFNTYQLTDAPQVYVAVYSKTYISHPSPLKIYGSNFIPCKQWALFMYEMNAIKTIQIHDTLLMRDFLA